MPKCGKTVLSEGYAKPGYEIIEVSCPPKAVESGSLPVTGSEAGAIGIVGLLLVALAVVLRKLTA